MAARRTEAGRGGSSVNGRPSHRGGLGRVHVGVLQHERVEGVAGDVGAVLPDAHLAITGRVLVGAADGPVRERDVLPLGERLAVALEPRHRLELEAEVAGARELVGDRTQLIHLLAVVGDGLVVPEDRVAVLQVVDEDAEVRPVTLGVELALHGVRGVVVLAEGRGSVVVEDRLAVRDVLLVARRLLGRLLAAHRRRRTDLVDRHVAELAQVPPVLDRAERRERDDQQRDHRAHAHDRETTTLLRALLLGTHLLDDRLAIGLDLLGHVRGPRGSGGSESVRVNDGRVYGTAREGRIRARTEPGAAASTCQPCAYATTPATQVAYGSSVVSTSASPSRVDRIRTRASSTSASSSTPAGTPKAPASAGSPVRARSTASRAPYPKKSVSSPRTRAAAPGPSSSTGRTRSERPRTTANGRPVSLPWASSAAPAISSATAGAVTVSGLPWLSAWPAKLSTTRRPAAPIAMSVCPSRHARPAVSVTTTPTTRPVRSRSRRRNARAEASGSIGSSTTWPGATF